ncbi:carbohydrate ABC transporter membrane protein 1, CUT1 family (TC 3.A.1.1.-) [Rhizobium sp. NFR07]|nr:carbohydrate ABC transporter membrane protein 1, CUT1 family (TC 3.A.1.1.-) [Rhizobium sp. NFR07]
MAMLTNRRKEVAVAATLVAPFVLTFALVFLYPAIRLVELSLTNSPLIGPGEWVGLDNFKRLLTDKLFLTSLKNNGYFILLTVIPTTALALFIALMITRLRGPLQALALAVFFLPYILPVSVVTQIWTWMLDFQFGVLQPVISFFYGKPVPVFKNPYWVMPMVAMVTIWWTNGFNVLLFIAGLRNIPKDYYEAAQLDGATRLQLFTKVTWPLLWPVTALVLTLQLILQLKIFDQVYLLSSGGPFNSSYVLLLMVYREAFQLNHGGYASAIALVLFVVIAALSVLQFQLLRAGGRR